MIIEKGKLSDKAEIITEIGVVDLKNPRTLFYIDVREMNFTYPTSDRIYRTICKYHTNRYNAVNFLYKQRIIFNENY